jgi:DNA polymerase-3 subunit beta
MKVICDRKDMESGILTAFKAVNAKGTLPILTHLLVHAENDMLRFSATDLEMVIECQVRAQVVEPGAFTAPAKLLSEIVTQLPESEVSLDLVGPQLRVKTRSSNFLVNTLSHEEYPVLPQPEEGNSLVLSGDTFREMVRSVLFAVAPPEETRAILTGILTQIEPGRAMLVTTDGRRLARVEKAIEAAEITSAYKSIIPARAMGELMRLLADSPGPLRITPSAGQVFFRFGQIQLVARLLEEGKFPDSDAIIPRSFQRTVHAHREQFLGAIRRALIMAQEKESPRLIKLEISSDAMSIRSNTPDLGQACEQMPVRLEGEPITIAFNGRFLLDAVSNTVGEELRMFLNDPLSMAMLRPVDSEELLYLVMPVRIKEPVPAGV